VKRFLWAAVLALSIHALLFGFGGHFFHKKIVKPTSQPLSFTLVANNPKSDGKKRVKMAAKAEVPQPSEPEKVISKVKPPAEEAPVKIHKPALRKKPVPKKKPVQAPKKKVQPKKKTKSVRQKPKTIDAPEVPAPHKGITSENHPAVQPKSASADVKTVSFSGPRVVSASPAYARNPRPKYPRIARRRGHEGVVLLKVLVDHEGRVDDVLVLKSSGHNALDHSALKAVKNWVFKPGTVDGRPMEMWVRVPVRFELKRR